MIWGRVRVSMFFVVFRSVRVAPSSFPVGLFDEVKIEGAAQGGDRFQASEVSKFLVTGSADRSIGIADRVGSSKNKIDTDGIPARRWPPGGNLPGGRGQFVFNADFRRRNHSKISQLDLWNLACLQFLSEIVEVLSPVEIGIGKVPSAPLQAPRPFIEIGDVMRMQPQSPEQGGRHDQGHSDSTPAIGGPERWRNRTCQEVEQGKSGKDVAKPELHAHRTCDPYQQTGGEQHQASLPNLSFQAFQLIDWNSQPSSQAPPAPNRNQPECQTQDDPQLCSVRPFVGSTVEVIARKTSQIPGAIEIDGMRSLHGGSLPVKTREVVGGKGDWHLLQESQTLLPLLQRLAAELPFTEWASRAMKQIAGIPGQQRGHHDGSGESCELQAGNPGESSPPAGDTPDPRAQSPKQDVREFGQLGEAEQQADGSRPAPIGTRGQTVGAPQGADEQQGGPGIWSGQCSVRQADRAKQPEQGRDNPGQWTVPFTPPDPKPDGRECREHQIRESSRQKPGVIPFPVGLQELITEGECVVGGQIRREFGSSQYQGECLPQPGQRWVQIIDIKSRFTPRRQACRQMPILIVGRAPLPSRIETEADMQHDAQCHQDPSPAFRKPGATIGE